MMSIAPSQTSTPPAPQPSALPPPSSESSNTAHQVERAKEPNGKIEPPRKPLLRLELRDLSSEGSRAFLRLLHASTTLEDAVDTVLRLLYTGLATHCIPPTRSVTLVLRSMPGVAYTTGLDIDDDHKEIHFSTDYISHVSDGRRKEEMQGVIVHEMVHCWQHNALGTAPGGLIEGIADWVRLKAGFAPPHWKRRTDCDWDAGYERTGFFLEWLEQEHGEDIVRKINEGLRGCEYDADSFWHSCCGKKINELWEKYKTSLGDDREGSEKEQECSEHGIDAPEVEHKEETQEESPSDTNIEHGESSRNATDGDHRTPQQKARRGGNMHIPVRPRTSS